MHTQTDFLSTALFSVSCLFWYVLPPSPVLLTVMSGRTAATAAARRVANLIPWKHHAPRPHPVRSSSLLQRRGMAGGPDHHGAPKVNFWEDPFSPSKWKEKHFVVVSMTGSGVLIYGGYKYFARGDIHNNKEENKVGGEPAR